MKKLSVSIAIVSILVMLAGCTGSPSPAVTTAPAAQPTAAAATAKPSAAVAPAASAVPSAPAAPSGLKLKDPKPVLKILMPNQADDYNTYPTAIDIEKLTGYKAQYDMLPQDAAMDKLNLIMASEEDYDIITGTSDAARIMQYAREGAVMDINPYLQYAANLNAALNDYERSSFTLDGKLYAIGMQNLYFETDGKIVGEVRMLPFYRKDWAEACGITAMPKTTDEFTAMLRAFKTYDNGTGVKTIPMTADTTMQIDGLLGAFGVPNVWNERDGKLVHRVADPKFKDYIAYLKSLFQEGLLDNEFPANKAANKTERYANGAAGCAFFGYWDTPALYDTMAKTQPNHKTQVLAPLTGPTGERGYGSVVGGFDRVAYIPKVTKNIDDVINYVNIKLEPENIKIITIGYEGVDYYMKGEEYWPILPTFFQHRNSSNFYTGRYSDLHPIYWMCRARKDERQYANWAFMNFDQDVQSANVLSKVNMAPVFPNTTKNKAALDQMVSDKLIKVIAGSESVESWDNFLKDWLAAGGQAMIDEYNAWWPTFQFK